MKSVNYEYYDYASDCESVRSIPCVSDEEVEAVCKMLSSRGFCYWVSESKGVA